MKFHTYYTIRIVASVIVIAAVALYLFLPDRVLHLYPHPKLPISLYSGTSDPSDAVDWIDEQSAKWRCVFSEEIPNSCGFSIGIAWDSLKGLDFTQYSYLKINAKYEGTAKRVRLFLRNYNPEIITSGNIHDSKFLYVLISARDFEQEVIIQKQEINVAEWWIGANPQLPRTQLLPELDNIVVLGIDYLERGTHVLDINSISIHGNWISREQLYLFIIMVLVLSLVIEGGIRYFRLRSQSAGEKALIDALVNSYKKVDDQRHEAEALSHKDGLTGVLNRNGLDSVLETLYNDKGKLGDLAVVLFDIDHFKRVNDRRGHASGDRVLVETTQQIQKTIRKEDIIGRWGGEEFIIITRQPSQEGLQEMAEKVRRSIQNHIFEPDDPLFLTISLGAGFVKDDETFADAFKRIDAALYKAKESGRNCAVYA